MLTFGNIIRQHAENNKDKAAVIFRQNQLTYGQLNSRANQLANAFLDLGYIKGDKVAVLMKNHMSYIEIIIGLAKIGVVSVPLNFRLIASEIEYIVLNSESRGFITTADYGEIAENLRRNLPQLDTVLVIGGTP